MEYVNRSPKLKRDVEGKIVCRGCGGAIPKGRRTWCSRECAGRYDPGLVNLAVKVRDKGVCQLCGLDVAGQIREWEQSKPDPFTVYEAYSEWKRAKPQVEYDHIKPMAEGGLTIIENMRTLCVPCHRKVTAEWRRTKKKQSNTPKANA